MNAFLNWTKTHKLHVLIWTVYLIYESIAIGLLFGSFEHLLTYIVSYGIILVFFFFNTQKGLPWALGIKEHIFLRLSAILAIEMTIYVVAGHLVNIFLTAAHMPGQDALNLNYQYILSIAFRASLYLGFSCGYYYLLIYNKERLRNAELEKQRFRSTIREQRMIKELSNAQNAFLKAQINPHFLFNTLDFVYHHINITSAVAADAIINLAGMMRYALSSGKDGDFIDLADEIEQVEHLLHLHQLKKDNKLNIKFFYSNKVTRIKLIPLVLLTLVENMFKHGNLSDPADVAYIKVGLTDNEFSIETYNLIRTTGASSTSTGLQNIERRLKHAYGNAAKLHYLKTDAHFNIKLTLPADAVKGSLSTPAAFLTAT